MRRIIFTFFTLITCIIFAAGCSQNEPRAKSIVIINKLHNGDAKFFGDGVFTSVDGTLTRLDMDGNVKMTYPDAKTNWIDGLDDKRVMVYGNFQKELGILEFDKGYNISRNEVLFRGEHLMIDPTISSHKGKYYLTFTEIKGMVNNADETRKSGEYTLRLYSSTDLKKWDPVSEITHEHNNIEDVDILTSDDEFLAVYEKESVDKGKSAIILKRSTDMGKTWSDEITLLEAGADQEPAVFIKKNDGYKLYYSSDIAFPGKSYMGARAYYALYDKSFKAKEKDHLISTETEKGILLYDVATINGTTYLLYARNYLTDCDLAIASFTALDN